MTNLPQWLLDELPEIKPINYIDFDEDKRVFTFKGVEFGSATEAYDSADRNDTVAFSEAAEKAYDGEVCSPFYFGDDSRLLLRKTNEDDFEYLEMVYGEWLKNNNKYQRSPDNWATAYKWLRIHPAFWIKYGKDADKKTWDWNTENGIDDIYTYIGVDDDGSPLVCMEAGGHTPDYLGCYHDYKLDVYEKSFEDAYVALAKNINENFNVDGTDKRLDSPE